MSWCHGACGAEICGAEICGRTAVGGQRSDVGPAVHVQQSAVHVHHRKRGDAGAQQRLVGGQSGGTPSARRRSRETENDAIAATYRDGARRRWRRPAATTPLSRLAPSPEQLIS